MSDANDKPKGLPRRSLERAAAPEQRATPPRPDVPIPALPTPPRAAEPPAIDDTFEVSIDEEDADPWGDGPSESVRGRGLVLDTLASAAPTRAPQAPDSFAMLMEGADELFALGDFSGSLETVEKALEIRPHDPTASALLTRIKDTLLKMYESKLGGLNKRPRVRVDSAEIMWLNIDHRAGFVLAQIDGVLTYEDVIALSGMSRFDTCRILAALVEEGVIDSA